MNEVRNIVAVLAILAITAGCSSNKTLVQAPQAVQAQPMSLQPAATDAGLRFSAVVTPDAQAPLSFRIPGYVVSLKQVRGQDGRLRDLQEGDRVGRGAVLVRIRSSEYQDRVHQASSQVASINAVLQKAKLDFDRATRLYAVQSITKPDFDAAKAQYDAVQEQLHAAQAQTSDAEIALRDTALVAPFEGDIVKKSIELGAVVNPGMPLLAVAKTDVVKIVIGVPDTVVQSVKVGQPVDVAIDAFPARTFHARVSRISSAADAVTRNFEVEVAIPNRDHLLKVGMIGSLQLASPEAERRASLQVPLSSIVQAKDGKYGVFVIADTRAGEVARLRGVELGAVNGTDIAVVNGLSSADRIITTGANLLKDGQRVEVVK